MGMKYDNIERKMIFTSISIIDSSNPFFLPAE